MNERPIFIDGHKENDWKKAMEGVNLYIAVVDKYFCDDIRCIEQTLFAKDRQIPTIILMEEGIELSVPDLFNKANVVAKYIFNDHNALEIKEKLQNKIIELSKGHRINIHKKPL